jgi:hypothetical protein
VRRSFVVLVAAAVAVVTFCFAVPAGANVIGRRDGNDSKSPLDMSGFKISDGGSSQVFKITTFSRFTNKQIDGKAGNFFVGIDTNADNKYDYHVYILFAAGKMRGILTNKKGGTITYRLKASRQRRSASVAVPLSKIGNPQSYRAVALSYFQGSPCSARNPCVDGVPNRFPGVLADLTPPHISWKSVPSISSDASATLSYPIKFSVKDDQYGSGIKSWTVQSRPFGSSSWTKVGTGSKLSPTVQVLGVEGGTMVVRVIAIDKQGNKKVSPVRTTSVPFDDRNAAIVYSASTQATPAQAFLSTTSSIGNTQTATFTTSSGWSKICVIGGPTATPSSTANATLKINGGGDQALDAETDVTAPRVQSFCSSNTVSAGANTVVITGTSAEPYVIDGIVLVP